MSHTINIAENGPEEFVRALTEAWRILTLGKALSHSSRAVLAERRERDILLGEIFDRSGGSIIDARQRPIEDGASAAKLHAAVFAARPDANAAILLRAPRLAAWGLARRPLPVRYFQMFSYTRARELPVTAPTPEGVSRALSDFPDIPALLLEDGRALIWGPQAARVVRLVLSLEEAANVTSLADLIGGAKDYPAEAREKIYLSLQAQKRN